MKNKVTQPIIDERLELLFRHAGLGEKQAKLYRILLNDGDQKASVLARKTGIKRSNAYVLLKDLKNRGLVTEFDKGKISYFRPEPPAKLNTIIGEIEKNLNLAKELADDMLPKLTTQWKTGVNKPVIKYMEGEEGVKNIFEDIYAAGKSEIIGCVGLENPHEELYRHIIKKLAPLRIRRKIFTKALNTDSKRAREAKKFEKDRLSRIYLANPNKYPLPAEIDVYEDKITFLSFEKEDFIGLLIENEVFATTLRSVFQILFDLMDGRHETKDPKLDSNQPEAATPQV